MLSEKLKMMMKSRDQWFLSHMATPPGSLAFRLLPQPKMRCPRCQAQLLRTVSVFIRRADDVYVTLGCTQAIEIVTEALARPGANVLLPRPGFSHYEARAACTNLEVRHYNLIPEQGWEIDLENVKALSDENTICHGHYKSWQSLWKCLHPRAFGQGIQVKLNISLLDDTNDDLEFCLKLAQEQSVVIVPGMALGMKNWLRTTFAIEPSLLEDGLRRINAFCKGMPKSNEIFWGRSSLCSILLMGSEINSMLIKK
ncbi:Aspartate 1-decarboxylase, pyridoxal-dependent [Parasponia andersonii]|uniref:Aspartate 1-decarboxylase, pyridoxal-dependent n=1 Tax=Parasponia andersonii TaxID=3476 RepID=A0A2P5AE86_PARAD|nr:Aspartate 1-decarboxylase, pyridoxal-dependent [Parasponia andersonii]